MDTNLKESFYSALFDYALANVVLHALQIRTDFFGLVLFFINGVMRLIKG